MSYIDVDHADAMSVITAIRKMSDSATKQLIELLSTQPTLTEELTMILEDVDDDVEIKPKAPDEPLVPFRLPDSTEHMLPRSFLEALVDANEVRIEDYVRKTERNKLATDLTVLANVGFPMENTNIEPIPHGDCSFGFLMEDEPLVAPEMAQDIAHMFNNVETREVDTEPPFCHPMQATWDQVKRRIGGRSAYSDDTVGHILDLSKGEGQHISGLDSEKINSSGEWAWGLTLAEKKLCEIEFREVGARGRLERLRETYHTKPSQRGKFSLLALRREGVTLLLYGGRVLTFGWTRKLPRVPNWKVLEDERPKQPPVKSGPDFRSTNRYSPFGE